MDDDEVTGGSEPAEALSTGRRGRNGHGEFTRTAAGAEHDAECLRLRDDGRTLAQVGQIMGVSESSAHRAIDRALAAIVQPVADAFRERQLRRLDAMYVAVMGVLETTHFTVSNGRLIDIDGAPLVDDAPVLAAVDRLLKIEERIARLTGIDAPARVDAKLTDGNVAEFDEISATFSNLLAQKERQDRAKERG